MLSKEKKKEKLKSLLHAPKAEKVSRPKAPTESQKAFANRKIRVISYFNNTMFTVRPSNNCAIGLAEILEYSLSKLHENLEGVITDVVTFDKNLSMQQLLDIQHSEEYDLTFVSSRHSCYLTANPSGVRVWPD